MGKTGALVAVESSKNAKMVAELLENKDLEVMEMAAGCLIMLCRGDTQCVYKDTCPYCRPDSQHTPPFGSYCPLEIAYLSRMYQGYKEEVCPTGANWSMLCTLKDVAALELNVMRSERQLAIDGALVELVAVGIDKSSGKVIEKPEVSAKATIWQQLLREKLRFLEQLGLTPKSKAQIGSTVSKDPSTYAAETLAAFEDIIRRRQKNKGKGVNANVIDVEVSENRARPDTEIAGTITHGVQYRLDGGSGADSPPAQHSEDQPDGYKCPDQSRSPGCGDSGDDDVDESGAECSDYIPRCGDGGVPSDLHPAEDHGRPVEEDGDGDDGSDPEEPGDWSYKPAIPSAEF